MTISYRVDQGMPDRSGTLAVYSNLIQKACMCIIVGTGGDATTLARVGRTPMGVAERPVYPRITERRRQRINEVLHTGPLGGFSNEHRLFSEARSTTVVWHGLSRFLQPQSATAPHTLFDGR